MTRPAGTAVPRRILRAAAAALAAAVLGGCASGRLMESSARSAADRLTALQAEIQRKINAEDAYYDEVLDNARGDLQRTRESALDQQLEQQARLFLTQPNRPPVSGPVLATYMQTVVTGWSESETQRQNLLDEVTRELTSGRRQLDANAARVATLRNRLRSLGEARSRKQLAAFVFEFSEQTLASLDELEAAEE